MVVKKIKSEFVFYDIVLREKNKIFKIWYAGNGDLY